MNNKITLAGIVDGELEYSHEIYGEKFYKFMFSTERKSGTKDKVLCMAPEVISDKLEYGNNITIIGEVRNYNKYEEGKNHSIVYVFVKEVLPYDGKDRNEVEMNGFICKETIYRETPLGRRVCDFILAVNRMNYKSDYIPCIAWGRNALRASIFNVGDNIKLTGRLQSREYTKKFDDGTEEVRTAYEVSSSSVVVVEKEESEE